MDDHGRCGGSARIGQHLVRVLAALSLGCGEAPPPVAADAAWTPAELALLADLRLVTALPPDPSNRVADDPDAAALGQELFFDNGLSPAGISCAHCHQPALGFTDGLPLARGAGVADRHTPTIAGAQTGPYYFWDGRADSLWMQALGPLENPAEMASDRVFVAGVVAAKYAGPYEALFGPLPDLVGLPAHGRPDTTDPAELAAWRDLGERQVDVDRVFANVGKAIAAYERQLLPGESAFDRYVDALPNGELDPAALRGLQLFVRGANCVSCHNGPLFTDRAFHNLGLPEAGGGYDQGRTLGAMKLLASEFNCRGAFSDTADCQELRYLNPNFPDFESAFKTPTLRGVTATAPYMHNGGMAGLPDVLAFYSDLPGKPLQGHRELTLVPLHLDAGQRDDLVAFLHALDPDPLPEALISPP
jgi:cytochrome c peroxidase